MFTLSDKDRAELVQVLRRGYEAFDDADHPFEKLNDETLLQVSEVVGLATRCDNCDDVVPSTKLVHAEWEDEPQIYQRCGEGDICPKCYRDNNARVVSAEDFDVTPASSLYLATIDMVEVAKRVITGRGAR